MKLAFLLIVLLWQAPAQEDRLSALKRKLQRADAATAAEFLEQAAKEPDPAVRRLILDRIGRLRLPAVREALARHAAADPDPRVALMALERLRVQQAQELGEIFEKRLALARDSQDSKAEEALVAVHQRWATHARGAVMPMFLQQPPAVFEAISRKPAIRVLVFGDFGREGTNLTSVASAAAAYHRKQPFDLGLTVGDNFEPDGVLSPSDPRWKGGWEQVYHPLGIPIFASTGNHDWGFPDSPAAQILYSKQSRTWRMPALYYSFTAGPAQFFALATQAMSSTQLHWLKQELERSTARWKIVYGHHPVYSHGTYGPVKEFQAALAPVLANRADVYLCGHEHSVQHIGPVDGVHYFVGAAAGQDPRPGKKGPQTRFVDHFLGFTTLEISSGRIRVQNIDADGTRRYQTDIVK